MAAVTQSAPVLVRVPRSSSLGSRPGLRYWVACFVGILLLAAALRVAAARGELWLDEVWSNYLVEEVVHSPADVIIRLRHDNNHMLNSWVAYAVGPLGEPWHYRAPAIVAGIATVWLAGWAQRRSGPAAVLAAMVLVAFSYLLVHYASEARGYAALTVMMLLTYGALREADATGRIGWEILIAISCVLGFLANPLFLTMYLAIQVWTWLPDGKPTDASGWRKLAKAALFRSLVPGAFLAWLYWVNFSRMHVGGGDARPYLRVVVETLSLTCGGAFQAPWSYVSALATLVFSAAAWTYVFRRSPRRACFYAAVIIAMPAALLAVAPRDDVYPRYFLGSVVFLYLLWSESLAALYERSLSGRRAGIVLLGLFVVANLFHVAQLISLGRSHYRAAIDFIESQTAGPQINLAADHGFRHLMMLHHLSATTPLDKPVVFEPRDSESMSKADWFLTHSLDPSFVPPEAIRLDGGQDFELVRSYPFAGLSGWQLNVYRRVASRLGPAE